MASTLTSSLARSADAVLRDKGTTLAEWLAAEVADDHGLRVIASRLHAATGGVVTPSHETVRRWIDQLVPASA